MAKKTKNKKGTGAGLAQNDLNDTLLGAISESNDPAARLKKLKSPLNPLACVFNILLLAVGTILVGFIVCAIVIDDFKLSVVLDDVLAQFGLKEFFDSIKQFFTNIFGGGKGDGETERILTNAVLKFLSSF